MVSIGKSRDFGSPFRRFGFQMRCQIVGAIRVLAQIVPIGKTFGEQHMHHRAGKRAIGSGAHGNVQIGFRRRRVR